MNKEYVGTLKNEKREEREKGRKLEIDINKRFS